MIKSVAEKENTMAADTFFAGRRTVYYISTPDTARPTPHRISNIPLHRPIQGFMTIFSIITNTASPAIQSKFITPPKNSSPPLF